MRLNTPAVKNTMAQFGLTLEVVSNRANCTMVEAYEALHLHHFRLSPLIIIVRVRRAVEDELYGRGWNGRREQLWTDFDARLERYLQGICPVPQRKARIRSAHISR